MCCVGSKLPGNSSVLQLWNPVKMNTIIVEEYYEEEKSYMHEKSITFQCHGRVDMSSDCGSQGPRFKSHHSTNVLWQDIDLHLPLSTQVLNGYPVGCESWQEILWGTVIYDVWHMHIINNYPYLCTSFSIVTFCILFSIICIFTVKKAIGSNISMLQLHAWTDNIILNLKSIKQYLKVTIIIIIIIFNINYNGLVIQCIYT